MIFLLTGSVCLEVVLSVLLGVHLTFLMLPKQFLLLLLRLLVLSLEMPVTGTIRCIWRIRERLCFCRILSGSFLCSSLLVPGMIYRPMLHGLRAGQILRRGWSRMIRRLPMRSRLYFMFLLLYVLLFLVLC